MKLLIITLAMLLPVQAQTAKVIPLSPQDAVERQSLERQRADIDKKIRDLDAKIRKQYTAVLEGEPDASNDYVDSAFTFTGVVTECFSTTGSCETTPLPRRFVYRRGWEYGVVYSEDFKYIVPQEAPKCVPSSYGYILSN